GRRFKPSHSDHPKAQVPGLFDSSTEANETPAASLDRQGCRKAGAVAGNDPPLEQHQLAWRMGGDGFGDAARGEGKEIGWRAHTYSVIADSEGAGAGRADQIKGGLDLLVAP